MLANGCGCNCWAIVTVLQDEVLSKIARDCAVAEQGWFKEGYQWWPAVMSPKNENNILTAKQRHDQDVLTGITTEAVQWISWVPNYTNIPLCVLGKGGIG